MGEFRYTGRLGSGVGISAACVKKNMLLRFAEERRGEFDLARLHDINSFLVAFCRDAGAGVGGDGDGFFRVEGFEEEGVRDDADVGAEAEEQDFFAVLDDLGEQIGRAHV